MLSGVESVRPPPEKGPTPSLIRPQLSHQALSVGLAPARARPAQGQAVVISRNPPPQMSQAPAWSTSGVPPWSTLTRPLSDIRELTEPSLLELSNRGRLPSEPADCGMARKCSLTRKASLLSRKGSMTRKLSVKSASSPTASQRSGRRRRRCPSPFRTPGSDRSSVYSIPIGTVPPRSSSRTREHRAKPTTRGRSLPPPAPRGLGHTIPNKGLARSPVREIAARLDPVSSDVVRRVPSRTFSREASSEMVDFPIHRHPRVSVDILLAAPLFVGGGSLEGNVRIAIEDAERQRHKRALAIARISVDLLGVEEMWGARRHVFINLATELIDSANPPSLNMVDSVKQVSPLDPFWLLRPSVTTMPFSISLPLDVGPPPFHSKLARTRYVLCCTLLIRDKGVQYLVRSSQDVAVLSVYDRKPCVTPSLTLKSGAAEGEAAEKALMSLPSPLTASDVYVRPREAGAEVIRVTAGLHRQVWVSGTSIFVDVHVVNSSRKTIKRLEVQLERDVLCYKHSAASTLERSAGQARIFDSNERAVLARAWIKQGTHGWPGVAPHAAAARTCDLEIPRGHATVKCGKFFEVRYFLNVIASSTHSKLVTVQLPIVLIHMNSLDVVPNSVAQVAAAIEEKRGHKADGRARALARRPSRSVQGRAFAAPRLQSLERTRTETEDLRELGRLLERSPRKYKQTAEAATAIRADGSVLMKGGHVIRRAQSATPKLSSRGAGRKHSSDNVGINHAVGLGYGYHSSNNLAGGCLSASEHHDSDEQLAKLPPRHHRRTASNPGLETPTNGNRQARLVEIGSMESIKGRLRHARTQSSETNRSQRSASGTLGYAHQPHGPYGPASGLHSRTGSDATLFAAPRPPVFPLHAPPLPPKAGQVDRQIGFREAEIGGTSGEQAVDLGTGGSGGGYPSGAAGGGTSAALGGTGSGATSFKARLEAARDRQWRLQNPGHHGAKGQLAGCVHHNGKKWKVLPERGLEWIMGDKEEREKEKEKERRRAMDDWI